MTEAEARNKTPIYGYNPRIGVYTPLNIEGDAELERIMFSLQGVEDISANKLKETIKRINAKAPILEFPTHNVIAFKNVLFDIDSMAPVEPTPSRVVTTRIETATYDPTALENEWLDLFMDTLFPHDEEMKQLAYEVIGSALTSDRLGKLFLVVGEGGNGKSEFLKLIRALYGDRNVASLSIQDFDDRFRIIGIVNRLVNLGDDIDKIALLGTGTVKKIVTGEHITAEAKGRQAFTYKPRITLIFTANKLPSISDNSQGMFDRIVVVPFNERIRNTDKAVPHIIDKIINTGGIPVLLNRAIEGLKRVQANRGFTLPHSVKVATAKYRIDNDHIALFLEAFFEGDLEGCYSYSMVANSFKGRNPLLTDYSLSKLYQLYKEWATFNGFRPFKNPNFAEGMERLGYKKWKMPSTLEEKRIYCWVEK